ncbi:hypothetical protein [Flavobacterium ardleyense]|uniref:hypothetical protein n=1 Tax=Flavobacterium ardleyense TaxID=2038737 RepID=UPI00298C29B4|nr:hypothetical protein [Flavobacterium ardleyense]
MTNPFIKRLLLLFSSATLLVYGTIYACGGGDWDWFFDSNFAPEAFVDKSYTPLFLSGDIFYDGTETDFISRYNDDIVVDWKGFLGNKMSDQQLKYFLLDSSYVEVMNLQSYYKSGKITSEIKRLKNKLDIKNPKVKSFIEFLAVAKEIEAVSVTSNPWSYEPIQYAVLNDAKLLANLKKMYQNENDSFLKNRYWFQYMKGLFYSRNLSEIATFFDQTSSTVPKNDLYYRAMGYVAGIHYKNQEYSKSNYLFSIIFDENIKMRKTALFNFHPQQEVEWNNTLQLAKSAKEKSALWALYGYYNDEILAIQKIAELDPKNPNLDFLLTRVINKVESQIDNSLEKKSIVEYRKSVQRIVDPKTIQLINSIASSSKVASPYLWFSAEGYIMSLTADFKAADIAFAKAEKYLPNNDLAKAQLELLKVTNRISATSSIKSANIDKLTADIDWLTLKLPALNIENLRYDKAVIWSKQYLSRLYKDNGNIVMAELFVPSKDFYTNQNDIELMKSLLTKAEKSKIQQIAVNQYYLKLDDIFKFQAVTALYNDKVAEAIGYISQSGDLQQIEFLANPFNGFIKDCHDCEHRAPQKKKFTQLDFLITMQTLQIDLANSTNSFSNALLLGNAFYNITFYGNGRTFYEGSVMGDASYVGGYDKWAFEQIVNMGMAKKYYYLALKSAENDEQRAKAHYMLAKCERNEYYQTKFKQDDYYYSWNNDKVNFLAWNGFKALKNDYRNTKYYQEVLQECGYFKTYVNQR